MARSLTIVAQNDNATVIFVIKNSDKAQEVEEILANHKAEGFQQMETLKPDQTLSVSMEALSSAIKNVEL